MTTHRGLRLWENPTEIEVGLDECARGCLFGRTYAAAVVWNPEWLQEALTDPEEFEWIHMIRDSKKLSPQKRVELADYIRTYALAYSVQWASEEEIDRENILQAVQSVFHQCLDDLPMTPDHILVDGNTFRMYSKRDGEIIPHRCIEQGDDKYFSIASASILAKVEHDAYIQRMCEEHPELVERYDIGNNMGYGTQTHLAGIRKHGISPWHRRSFGICKTFRPPPPAIVASSKSNTNIRRFMAKP